VRNDLNECAECEDGSKPQVPNDVAVGRCREEPAEEGCAITTDF